MKNIIVLSVLFSTAAYSQTWTETFKLPEGTTHRARTAGYDCGTFGNKYVNAPVLLTSRNIEFKQLSADKDLNKFLFEAEYPGSQGNKCIYGIFLDRSRDTKTLNFTNSQIKTGEGLEDTCLETKEFLDQQFVAAGYEGSKRGLRYVAVDLMKDTPNEVCESGQVRIVFDRRFAE